MKVVIDDVNHFGLEGEQLGWSGHQTSGHLVPTVRLNGPSGDTAGLARVEDTLGAETKTEAAGDDFCHGRPSNWVHDFDITSFPT